MSKRQWDEGDVRHVRTTNWDRVALLVVLLVIVGLAAWWLETRFGANWAAGALGVLAGVVVFAWGGAFAYGVMRSTMSTATQFHSNIADVEERRLSVNRSAAQVEALRARAELDYDRDVRRVADQRARLLIDAQREERPASPAWLALDDDPAESSFRRVD